MKTVRFKFVDFWKEFNLSSFYLFKMIQKTNYNLIIDEINPDIVLGSGFGHELSQWKHKKRIFYTGENIKCDFSKYDYFIGHEFLNDPRNLRVPFYQIRWGEDPNEEKLNNFFDKKLKPERNKFCAFIHSNDAPSKRKDFFYKLSTYKKVDSGGSSFNNIGYLVDNKIEWLKNYKFVMCFENDSSYGYLTEKLYDAMQAGCIPIYWGSKSCSDEFNGKSFINWHDYNNDEDVINRIMKLDKDPIKYNIVYSEPFLKNREPNMYMDDNRVIEFFKKIIEEVV